MKSIWAMYSAAARRGGRRGTTPSLLGLALLAGLLFLLSGCQRVAPVVKVALVAPFEGRHRSVGYDVLYSARLAVREVNAAGGIGGKRVALIALDDRGDPEFARAAAESLIVDPAVVAVVGHWLPATTTAAQGSYREAGLALLAGGQEPFQTTDPQELAPSFVQAYATVTPFDETPGPYAAAGYDAFETLWRLIGQAQSVHGAITRSTVKGTVDEWRDSSVPP